MYVNGMGFRAIERIKGVHHTSIINWVKQVGELLPNAYNPLDGSPEATFSGATFWGATFWGEVSPQKLRDVSGGSFLPKARFAWEASPVELRAPVETIPHVK